MATTPTPGLRIVSGANDDPGITPAIPHAQTAPGIALHPDSIDHLRPALGDECPDEFAKAAFQTAIGAMTTVSESVDAMVAARKECASHDPKTKHIGSDGQMTFGVEPALVPELIVALNTSFSGGAARLDVATKAIDQAEASLATKIQAAVTDTRRNEPHRVQLAAELRALVRQMPESARIGWVQDRITKGDKDEAFAVLSGSPYVSGISREMFDRLKTHAENTWAPKETEARKALGALRENLMKAAGVYYSRYAECIPSQAPAVAKSRDALARLKKGTA